MSFRELLVEKLEGICQLNSTQLERLERHYQLLLRWNQRLNLTSVRGPEEIAVRHYCESLFLGSRLPFKPNSVVDVGSGAGFPGVPMAILRPDCKVTLVESHKRKAVFLREATRSYPNVRILVQRAETITETFDWMVSRAVKWSKLPRLADTVALLLGAEDAQVAQIEGVVWKERITLPWGKNRVLLIGCST